MHRRVCILPTRSNRSSKRVYLTAIMWGYFMLRSSLIIVLLLSYVSAANSQVPTARVLPKADVIVSCYQDGTPAYSCNLKCGGGASISFSNVGRIEIYSKGSSGRPDQRIWMGVERRPNPAIASPTILEFMYLTNINACNWTTPELISERVRLELRIEKFDQ